MDALKPEDPARIGPFTTLARIGAGGMGRVYLARSRGGRPVAVKVIRAEYAEDERFRTRFRREVQAARSVNGMYTASVLDAGPDDAEPWLATTYIPGPSLQRVVHDHGPLPERSARFLGAGIAEALGAIHAAGLIHRDLKPSNVICAPDGPRVIDFGISHAVGGSSLTTTGIVVGSARYASPEQCRADPDLRAASDVFALGGVLVYATTGVPPFGDGPDHVQLYLVVHEKPDLTGVPMSLRPIVSACLEKDPANRPGTEELLDTLLPPDDAGMAGAMDWLPEAVHLDLRTYSAGQIGGIANTAGGAGPADGTDGRTHERAAEDPARTPIPVDPDATDAGRSRGSLTGAGSAVGTTAASAASSPAPASRPGRRRVLAGIAGVAAVAASGGGAWYAATRHTTKNAPTQNAGATVPAGSSTGSPSQTPTPTQPHALGQWGEDWSAKIDLGGAAGGALVSGDKLISVYTAASIQNPNPPQSLIAINTATGTRAWDPKSVPTIDNAGGAGIAADAQHIYSYGAGTLYAWNIADGSPAWYRSTGLQPSTSANGMPLSGIQGLLGTMLVIGPAGFDPSDPPCLAGFDVAARATSWTLATADLLTHLPDGLDPSQTSVQVTVPKSGNLFYVALSDPNSLRVLRAMDPHDGKEVWSVPFAAYPDNTGVNTPTVTGTEKHVYLTDMHSGSVHAYDTAGKWMWTHPSAAGDTAVTADQRFTGSVLESGDTAYATDANSVVALQISSTARAGRALWPKPKAYNGLANIPALVGDKIWVEVHTPGAADPLAMAVLNGADGSQVRLYPMPPGPSGDSADLLVPDPTGQAVYILTASGEVLGYRRDH